MSLLRLYCKIVCRFDLELLKLYHFVKYTSAKSNFSSFICSISIVKILIKRLEPQLLVWSAIQQYHKSFLYFNNDCEFICCPAIYLDTLENSYQYCNIIISSDYKSTKVVYLILMQTSSEIYYWLLQMVFKWDLSFVRPKSANLILKEDQNSIEIFFNFEFWFATFCGWEYFSILLIFKKRFIVLSTSIEV